MEHTFIDVRRLLSGDTTHCRESSRSAPAGVRPGRDDGSAPCSTMPTSVPPPSSTFWCSLGRARLSTTFSRSSPPTRSACWTADKVEVRRGEAGACTPDALSGSARVYVSCHPGLVRQHPVGRAAPDLPRRSARPERDRAGPPPRGGPRRSPRQRGCRRRGLRGGPPERCRARRGGRVPGPRRDDRPRHRQCRPPRRDAGRDDPGAARPGRESPGGRRGQRVLVRGRDARGQVVRRDVRRRVDRPGRRRRGAGRVGAALRLPGSPPGERGRGLLRRPVVRRRRRALRAAGRRPRGGRRRPAGTTSTVARGSSRCSPTRAHASSTSPPC